MQKQLFITFEGIDGSGKTTQAKLLHEYFIKCGRESIITKEFNNDWISSLISLIKTTEILSIEAEKMNEIGLVNLIMAVRQNHLEKVILPNLIRNKVVICDRFIDSTAVYQSKILTMEEIFEYQKEFFMPHITFLIDVDVDRANKNLNIRNKIQSFANSSVSMGNHSLHNEQLNNVPLDSDLSPKTLSKEILSSGNNLPQSNEKLLHLNEKFVQSKDCFAKDCFAKDWFDSQKNSYKENLIKKYRLLSESFSSRIVRIDGNCDIIMIHQQIIKNLEQKF